MPSEDEKETNGWDVLRDVLLRLIDLFGDKNRLGTLIVLVFFAILVLPAYFAMESEDLASVYVHFLDLSFRPMTLGMLGTIVFQLIGYKKWVKRHKREMQRLTKYKQFYFHYKDKLALFILDGVHSGKIKGVEDLEDFDIEDVNDIKHHSSRYTLDEGDNHGDSADDHGHDESEVDDRRGDEEETP